MGKKFEKNQRTQKGSTADKIIRSEVLRKFNTDQYMKEHEIRVAVESGVVMLEGTVASYLLRELAEDLASNVDGVVRVQNEIALGAGRPGEISPEDNFSADQENLSEASNLGDVSIHHPTTTGFTEVQSRTREDITGGIDSGTLAGQSMQSPIPTTGEGSSVMDAGAADAMKVSGKDIEEQSLPSVLKKGMRVVDRMGETIGKVKEVRQTDFLLNRPMARDVYVPYFECIYENKTVIVDVLGDDISDQGWAEPRLF